MREEHDTVIVGAGQAGLAMSHHLQQHGREHIILERRRIAERWRTERWDSLRFQLPNAWLGLPGKSYGGTDPDGFTHYLDVVRFILDYAAEIEAPVRTGVEVTSLNREQDQGVYVLETSEGRVCSRHVVIATGPFQRPLTPDFSQSIPPFVFQVHATHYRNPEELPSGAVLVVGTGNSGCQIADELLRSGRQVFLAVSRHSRAPRRYRGKDVIWWYEKLGRFDVNVESFPERKYPPTSIMTGINGGYDLDPLHLGRAGAILIGRVLAIDGETLGLADDVGELLAVADRSYAGFIEAADTLADMPAMQSEVTPKEAGAPLPAPSIDTLRTLDLRKENIRALVWANGYDFGFNWVKLPIIDARGAPIQQRGVTSSPGVYFLGLHWMHTFRSAILPFMGRDACYIADHIDRLAH